MRGSIRGAAAGLALCVGALALGVLHSDAALAQTSGTRTSAFAYDANTGLLTQEVIEPDTPALRLQTDYTFNAFGEKVAVAVSGTDIVTRTASTTYDAKGQFATSAANALSHSESFEYDPRFGTPTKHTGPNGLVTTWTYDDFGRKTLELRADGTRTTWSYLYCAGINGGTTSCPAGATHLVQVAALGPDGTTKIGPTATQYYDQLDRVIAADTEGFDGSPIRTETRYDEKGRVDKKSRPYFVVSGSPEWTTFTYDALGRVLTATDANGATTANAYSGLTTSVTNAASQTSTTTRNSQGQVVQVKDADNHTTSYEYEAFGSLTKVTDAAGNVTTYAYDTRGRKMTANDPDLGTASYTYDVLDKLKTQTNAASEITTLSYDLLGRLTQRTEQGLISTWTWDTAGPKGVGKLAAASTNGGYARTHTYDALGRPDQVQIAINGTPYTITTAYDAASRIDKVTYPSGFAVTYGYNATGYQYQLSNAATSEVYWTADARDAELHLTKQTAGNGVVTTQVFDPKTGRLAQITAGDAGEVQNQSFTYDPLGKLLARSDANTSLAESFEYDILNRLTKSIVSLTPTPLVSTFAYNAIGNMTFKSDVGAYSYPSPGDARPHGVSSISGGAINTTFTYDAKGNMTSGNGLGITYTAFNKPATITRGTASVSFDHDPEHQRYAQTSLSGVTFYLAGSGVLAERFAGSGGTVRWTNYLMVGGRYIGIRVENSDETTLTRYFHTDHLGSIAVITNEAAVVMERLSYDAWGVRRNPDGTPDPSGSIASQSSRGFTGHEHLAEVGLIHMNGRVYDPLLARFGTPDPTTEDPFSTQGWNRYAYVGNSPLNFTDPSGYCFLGCFWKPIFKAIGQFFQRFWGAILQTVLPALVCGPAAPVCAAVVGAITTTFVVGVTSGNLGMALRAGFISMVTSLVVQSVMQDLAPQSMTGSTPTGSNWDPPMRLCPAYGPCGPGQLPPIVVGPDTRVAVAKGVLDAVPGYEFSSLATKQFQAGNYIVAGIATAAAAIDVAGGGLLTVTRRGVVVTSQTLSRQGTSPLVGNFTGLAGASVDDVIARVPRGWTWGPQERGLGIRFFDESGAERIRMHGPSVNAPLGSNSASGWVLRVMDAQRNYYDDLGGIVLRHANEGHVPLLGNPRAP